MLWAGCQVGACGHRRRTPTGPTGSTGSTESEESEESEEGSDPLRKRTAARLLAGGLAGSMLLATPLAASADAGGSDEPEAQVMRGAAAEDVAAAVGPVSLLYFKGGPSYAVVYPSVRSELVMGDVDSAASPADDPADHPVIWVGDGVWLLTDDAGERTINFGRAGDAPILGDWDGDGHDEVGVVRGNRFYLAGTNVNGGGSVTSFAFGRSSDWHGLVGDWDGNGTDEPALARGLGKTIQFIFATAPTDGGGAAYSRVWGRNLGDLPAAGDLDGDGTDSIVLQRSLGTGGRAPYFFVSHGSPADGLHADEVLRYGRVEDFPLVADADGDGADEIGVERELVGPEAD